jgi:hypothetical protein
MNYVIVTRTFLHYNQSIEETLVNVVFFPMQYCGWKLSRICMDYDLYDTIYYNFGLDFQSTQVGCYIVSWLFWSAIILKWWLKD